MNRRVMRVTRVAVTGALVLLSLGACAVRRPAELIRVNGDRLFSRGEFAAAADEYAAIVDRYPGDWRAQYMLGRSRLEVGEVATARSALEIAHTRRPDDVAIADTLAEAMHEHGDESALFRFLRDRAQDTRSTHAYLRLARYSLLLDDPDSAILAIDTAIDLDAGRTVDPYLVAAELEDHLGRSDRVMHRLRQAYGVDPTDERVHDRLRALGEVPGPTLALPAGR